MPVDLVLYSRPGCHLCDDMLAALEDMDVNRHLNVTIVNIDDDPGLRNAFDMRIPVLARADTREIICESRLDETAVLTCLGKIRE